MFLLWAIILLASYTIAQKSTNSEASFTIQTTSVTSSSPTPSTTWPVVSIFFPIKIPDQLGASIVRAGLRETVFAVHCLYTNKCADTNTFLITGGPSTFRATNTVFESEGSMNSPVTVSCTLSGGVPASSATCIRRSVISGLGSVDSVTTLADSQISYVPLTITAGEQKLMAMPTAASGSASSSSSGSSSGSGCEATAAIPWVMGGAAAVLLGGVL